MRIIYRFGILALLSGAAACSSDPKTATEATSSTSQTDTQPAASATARQPTTLHATPATEAAESEPAAVPASRVVTRATTKRRAAPVRQPGLPDRVLGSSLADKEVIGQQVATATTTPQLAAAPSSMPVTDVAAAAPDVRAYCAATLAPAQVFWVRPSRDTVLVGQQGTRVAVPANVWAVPAGSPPVRVELQEFYTTPDIILAGLSTRAGASLLETGGMVNLTATANQQPVALRPGQRLLLQMPTKRPLEGMQLFQDASAAGQHGTNWQLPATSAAGAGVDVEGFELEKDGRWPQLAGGDKALLKFFDKRIVNSRTIMARLRRYRPATDEEKQLLKESSKANRKKVLCAMRLAVKVDSTGAAYFAPLPYGDDELKATLLATARQLPKWRPARFRQLAAPHRLEKVQAVGVLTMLYTSGGKRLLGVQWDQGATHEPRFARYAARLRQEGRRQFAAQFASSGPLKLDESLYYEFEADGLGWINCDRFLEEGPRVEFTVQTPQPNTVVTLVFQQQRSILASSRTEQSAAVFAQVPTGSAATVVAVRREQGVTYLATTPVTMGQEAPTKLEFRPVSLTELRSALAQL